MRMHTGKAKKGFTLIELLIVVVIIGILAAIAIPKFASTKDKAKLASVKTDLRNYMTAEEAYFSDKAAYGSSTDLKATPYNYTMSSGNTVGAIDAATAGGYSIEITNTSISSTTNNKCSVLVGAAATSTTDGVITCS